MTALTPDKVVTTDDQDQYAGQENDDFLWNPGVFICHVLAWLGIQNALNYCGYFPFHNYRQVHVALNALTEGFNAPARVSLPGKLIFPKIPDCPKKWLDVIHYWRFAAAVGIMTYEFLAHIRIVAVIFILYNLVKLGTVTASDAYKIALQQLGGVTL
jgi:hypothetical protein